MEGGIVVVLVADGQELLILTVTGHVESIKCVLKLIHMYAHL